MKKTITSQADPGLVLAKLTPVDVLRRPAPEDVVPIAEAIHIALENRPEIKQARLAVDNAEINTTYTKNQTLPVLDLNAAYTQTGLGGIPILTSPLGGTAIIGLVPGGVSDALRQMVRADYRTYSFGFNLQIPFSNKAARSDYDRALSAKKLAQAQVDAIAQQIALDVRNAMNRVELNRAHIESAGKARELAQKTLDAGNTNRVYRRCSLSSRTKRPGDCANKRSSGARELHQITGGAGSRYRANSFSQSDRHPKGHAPDCRQYP